MADAGAATGRILRGWQSRPWLRGLGSLERWVLPAVSGTVVILVVYPLVFIVWRSLSTQDLGSAFTLSWYQTVVQDPELRRGILNTIILVASAVVCAMAMGTFIAFLTIRTDLPYARVVGAIAVLPLLVPPFMLVIGWIMLASPEIGFLNIALRALLHLDGGSGPLNIYSMAGMIWVTSLYLTPYVYMLTSSGFRAIDPSLEESARISGSGPIRVLTSITLPVMAPSILAASLLAVVMGAGQFIIPTTLGIQGNVYVLSTLIWQNMNIWPAREQLASAEGFILVAFGLLCLYGQRRLLARGSYATVTGKGFRPRKIQLGRWRYLALVPCLLYLGVSMALPMIAIVLVAFLRYWTTDLSWSLFTFNNVDYVLFHYPEVWTSVRNSLVLSVAGATLGMALSLLVSWTVIRTQAWYRRLIAYVSIVPLGIPGIALALGIMTAWINPPIVLYGTIWILLIAYITGHLPIGVQSVTGALHQVSSELEEGARIAGASWGRTLRDITLPLLRPALLSGWILLYVLMLRDISLSILLYTPATIVLSVGLFDIWIEAYYTTLAAYSLILFVLGAVPLILIQRLGDAGYEEAGFTG